MMGKPPKPSLHRTPKVQIERFIANSKKQIYDYLNDIEEDDTSKSDPYELDFEEVEPIEGGYLNNKVLNYKQNLILDENPLRDFFSYAILFTNCTKKHSNPLNIFTHTPSTKLLSRLQ